MSDRCPSNRDRWVVHTVDKMTGVCQRCFEQREPSALDRLDTLENEVVTLRALIKELENLVIGDGR